VSRLQQIIKHCIEDTTIQQAMHSDYLLEEMEDDENTIILHAGTGFLTPEVTENLRKRLIFVDATNASTKDGYSMKYFLHYLEPEEDTFMDYLAEPVSTDNSIEEKLGKAITEAAKDAPYTGDPYRIIYHVVISIEEELGVEILDKDDKSLREYAEVDPRELTERYIKPDLISEEELEQAEERLEGSALELFQELIDNALNNEKFYETLREERPGSDWHRIREVLEDLGGYRILDIRKSKVAQKHTEEGDELR